MGIIEPNHELIAKIIDHKGQAEPLLSSLRVSNFMYTHD